MIYSVQNKGYRITEYPDIITASEIESLLLDDSGNMQGICRHIQYFDKTDSTNNQAKLAAEKNAPEGTLFVAECQTGGRGRRGKTWESPAGSGIWMSLLLRPDISPESASMLTLVLAVAMVDAINEEVQDAKCYVKWPNDIVLNNRKISGTLTEMSAEMDSIHYVVIGIGINVNTTDFDESIKDCGGPFLSILNACEASAPPANPPSVDSVFPFIPNICFTIFSAGTIKASATIAYSKLFAATDNADDTNTVYKSICIGCNKA